MPSPDDGRSNQDPGNDEPSMERNRGKDGPSPVAAPDVPCPPMGGPEDELEPKGAREVQQAVDEMEIAVRDWKARMR